VDKELICKIRTDGTKEWFLNNRRHRENGPAIEWADGTKEWWFNGVEHRSDGAAIEWPLARRWFLDGIELCPEEAIYDLKLKINYPKLIESMIIYLVHNS
jgi:hypothetical protein